MMYDETLEDSVRNFLAVLFRDGGHKAAEFDSLPEALEYAKEVVLELIHSDYTAESQRDAVSQKARFMEGIIEGIKDDNAREMKKLTEQVSDLKQKIGELRAIL